MISKRSGRSLKESQLHYPKGGCRFAKHNLSIACYDCVSKLEQLCKIYAACEFFPGSAALVTTPPFQKQPPSFESPASIPRRSMPPISDSAFASACRPQGTVAREGEAW
jgi:hypothetical protein